MPVNRGTSPGTLGCVETQFQEGNNVREEDRRRAERPSMAESQLAELQNMRVLLEVARLLAGNLAYHLRAEIEARLEVVPFEIERQIESLWANRG